MYDAPIKICTGDTITVGPEIGKEIDGIVYEVVSTMNIDVDRQELIRALQYDRDQYDAGFADGQVFAEEAITALQNKNEKLHQNYEKAAAIATKWEARYIKLRDACIDLLEAVEEQNALRGSQESGSSSAQSEGERE